MQVGRRILRPTAHGAGTGAGTDSTLRRARGAPSDRPPPKKSFHIEGTHSVTAKASGIRRQAERGADGYCTVGCLERAVGAGRALAPQIGAALSLSRQKAPVRSPGPAGDPLRAAHGNRLDGTFPQELGFGSGVTCRRRGPNLPGGYGRCLGQNAAICVDRNVLHPVGRCRVGREVVADYDSVWRPRGGDRRVALNPQMAQ